MEKIAKGKQPSAIEVNTIDEKSERPENKREVDMRIVKNHPILGKCQRELLHVWISWINLFPSLEVHLLWKAQGKLLQKMKRLQ